MYLFLERWGNSYLQQGKTGYSEKALSVLTFCTSLTLYFRNGDLSDSVFLQNQSTKLPCTYLLMTNDHFLPDAIFFLSCQILTCLVKESIPLCTFPRVSICCAYFSALFRGWKEGCQELYHILYFAECSCTYFKCLFICEWNLHCAALIPEAVTKPMCVCGIFHLKLMYVVQAFWESIKKKKSVSW